MSKQAEDRDMTEGFIGASPNELTDKSDAELAEWQAGWRNGTAHHILAEREWERRLAVRQLQEQFKLDSRLAQANERAMRFAAILSVIGTLAGAVIGAKATLMASTSTGNQAQQQVELHVPTTGSTQIPASSNAR